MSSAILYLAIVAIWACVLVPRWLRRPHEQAAEQEAVFEPCEPGQAETAMTAPADGNERPPDVATQGEQDAVEYQDPVAWEDTAAPGTPGTPGEAEGPVETTYSVTATYTTEVTYSAEPAAGEAPPDAYFDADAPAYDAGVPDGGHVTDGGAGSGWPPGHVPVPFPGPSAHVVQARRRTLTMVLLIAGAALGSAFIGLTPWWTAVPPFLVLGAYVLLLREAASADADHARSWAETQARAARTARTAELARERAREAEAARQAQPVAQIINLSELAAQIARNEPYDQYADAEIRAVGD